MDLRVRTTVVKALALFLIAAGLPACQASPDASATTPGPAPASSPESEKRFRADAWSLPADDLLGFVEIPGGPFLMGSDPSVDRMAFDNERWSPDRPQGTVDLPAFYLGKYEVTVGQFRTFVEATAYKAAPPSLAGAADHPVTSVTWPDALAYCRWLERELKASPSTPAPIGALLREGWQVTLPTEAQWEKAARGSDGRIYPWGNTVRKDRANYEERGTMAVGQFECPECAYLLFDMSGNVWEWTRSPYQPYPYTPDDDRTNLQADALWVMRGGAFNDSAQNVRAAIRGGADPGVRRPFLGFRLALSKP